MYEIETPITHETVTRKTRYGVHTAAGSRRCSPDRTPIVSIGGSESVFVYIVGPHIVLKPRCLPTMCLPYAISTLMISRYAVAHE